MEGCQDCWFAVFFLSNLRSVVLGFYLCLAWNAVTALSFRLRSEINLNTLHLRGLASPGNNIFSLHLLNQEPLHFDPLLKEPGLLLHQLLRVNLQLPDPLLVSLPLNLNLVLLPTKNHLKLLNLGRILINLILMLHFLLLLFLSQLIKLLHERNQLLLREVLLEGYRRTWVISGPNLLLGEGGFGLVAGVGEGPRSLGQKIFQLLNNRWFLGDLLLKSRVYWLKMRLVSYKFLNLLRFLVDIIRFLRIYFLFGFHL